jgi:hypothetical protein
MKTTEWIARNCRFAAEQPTLFETEYQMFGKEHMPVPKKRFLCKVMSPDGTVVAEGRRFAKTAKEAEKQFLSLRGSSAPGRTCVCEPIEQ